MVAGIRRVFDAITQRRSLALSTKSTFNLNHIAQCSSAPTAKALKTSTEQRLTRVASGAPACWHSPSLLIVLLATTRPNRQPLPFAIVNHTRNKHNLANVVGGVSQ